MNTTGYVDSYNLIQNIFRKTTLCTLVLKKSHNFACGQYFFMKIVFIRHKAFNPYKTQFFMKNSQWSLFS